MHIAVERHTPASSLLHETIAKSVNHLLACQRQDGAWTDYFDTGVMADAQTVISLYLLDIHDITWTEPLLRRIESRQRSDGAWELYPGGRGDLSTTVECFYAMELHHRWHQKPLLKSAAKEFIRERGGLKKCRNLTKVFLAVGGEIPWSWLPSPGIYSWLFARYSPVRISQLVMFTRLHIPPMLVLSELRYVSTIVQQAVLGELVVHKEERFRRRVRDSISRLRREQTQEQVAGGRNTQSDGDLVKSNGHRFKRYVRFMLNEREDDGTLAGYHSSTFLFLLSLRALQYPTTQRLFTLPLQSMKNNVCMNDTEAGHQQTCNAHVWNTSIALQALESAGTIDVKPLEQAAKYLLSKQQMTVETRKLASSVSGSWGFSSNNTKHPDTDDTVSCLEALYPFREFHPDSWWKGVEWLLAMQNRDGGWSAFERNSGKRWLEWIPANDMKRSMTDPSTPDITGRVLEFLIRRQIISTQSPTIHRGIDWLVRQQNRDGSWFGRWGTPYTYGTWCAVRAFAAARISSRSLAIERAKNWVLKRQRLDGGFGESCESDVEGRYVPLLASDSTQTAWSLDTLLHLLTIEEFPSQRQRLHKAAQRAAAWLLDAAREGSFEEEVPTGSAFPGHLYIHYEIYPKVWPLMALCHYRDILRTEGR